MLMGRDRDMVRVWKLGLALLLASTAWGTQAEEESVCALVKIEIAQELTLERQGFEAIMQINNALPEKALTKRPLLCWLRCRILKRQKKRWLAPRILLQNKPQKMLLSAPGCAKNCGKKAKSLRNLPLRKKPLKKFWPIKTTANR